MRKLPPFAALRAFEAAARHLSFKQAAEELGLTPTAISHQVRGLEDLLGRALFIRGVRTVTLTPAGHELAADLGPALDALSAAVEKLQRGKERQLVTLGAGPILASRWLVPRLGDFWRGHPDIDLRMHHSPLPVARQLAQVDLAVAWGHGDWRGVLVEPLLRIAVTPVQAGGGPLAEAPLPAAPEELLRLPLLHHRDDSGWRQWLIAAGVPLGGDLPGIVLEDSNVLLQAMLDGQGVGLGIVEFVADEIAAGRLRQPFALAVDPGEAYYLVCGERALRREPVRRVRDWLLGARPPAGRGAGSDGLLNSAQP